MKETSFLVISVMRRKMALLQICLLFQIAILFFISGMYSLPVTSASYFPIRHHYAFLSQSGSLRKGDKNSFYQAVPRNSVSHILELDKPVFFSNSNLISKDYMMDNNGIQRANRLTSFALCAKRGHGRPSKTNSSSNISKRINYLSLFFQNDI